MLPRKTMITFYRGCGYEEETALNRADEYLRIQKIFNDSRDQIEEMTAEDDRQLTKHLHELEAGEKK